MPVHVSRRLIERIYLVSSNDGVTNVSKCATQRIQHFLIDDVRSNGSEVQCELSPVIVVLLQGLRASAIYTILAKTCTMRIANTKGD